MFNINMTHAFFAACLTIQCINPLTAMEEDKRSHDEEQKKGVRFNVHRDSLNHLHDIPTFREDGEQRAKKASPEKSKRKRSPSSLGRHIQVFKKKSQEPAASDTLDHHNYELATIISSEKDHIIKEKKKNRTPEIPPLKLPVNHSDAINTVQNEYRKQPKKTDHWIP